MKPEEIFKTRCIEYIFLEYTNDEEKAKNDFVDLYRNFYRTRNQAPLVPYDLITKEIYKIDTPEIDKYKNTIQMRINNCKIVNDAEISESSDDETKINDDMNKFLDSTLRHIELAIVQKKYIDKDLRKASKQFTQINDMKSKIYTDFVTILGIFASIMVAMFGGLSSVASAMRALYKGKVDIYQLISISSLFSLILIFVVFLLLKAISMISGHSIKSCGCDNKRCSCKFYKKYPLFCGTVIIFFIIFVVSLFLQRHL